MPPMTSSKRAGVSQRLPLPERKARTRTVIVDASIRLFRERGFDATAMADIAAAANVGVGTLYGYFSSKDQLLAEVLAELSQPYVERFNEAMAESASSIGRLLGALDYFAQFLREHDTILRAVFTGEHREAVVQRLAQPLAAYLAAVIRVGIEEGEMKPVPVDSAARMLLTTYAFATLRSATWRAESDPDAIASDLRELTLALLTRGESQESPRPRG